MEKNYNYEEIEQFLEGTLSKEVAEAIILRMREEEDFKEEVQKYKALHFKLKLLKEKKVLENFEKIKQNLELDNFHEKEVQKISEKVTPIYFSKRNWMIAAILLPLIALGLWWTISPATEKNLYATYYNKPNEYLIEEITKNNSSTGFIESKKDDYEYLKLILQDYYTANPQLLYNELEAYLEKYSDSNFKDDLILYQAIFHLEQKKFEEALLILTSIKNSELPIVSSHSNWYLALTYLAQNNQEKAIEILEQIKNDDNYGNVVKETLNHLK